MPGTVVYFRYTVQQKCIVEIMIKFVVVPFSHAGINVPGTKLPKDKTSPGQNAP